MASDISWDLLEKYAQPVPRYTSYPTAPAFHPNVNATHMQQALEQISPSRPVSLYTHFPFCRELCWYCGCNTRVNRRLPEREDYVDILLKEINLVWQSLPAKLPAMQVHFGGGTPNYMTDEQFERVMDGLAESFFIQEEAEVSIELDPRLIEAEAVENYAKCGINRVSLGIQDFNPQVQKAINRVQPFEDVRQCFEILRSKGISAINADLILGLPHQNEAAFRNTLQQMIELQPSRIAIFNFAYLPQRYAHMKLIKQEYLPTTQVKLAMMRASVELLTEAGYIQLGMDHFARPEDSLSQAFREGNMHRNFQGYTTMPEMDMIGFGASSISMFDRMYLQNHVKTADWAAPIQAGDFATQRGVLLSDADRHVRHVIERVMCTFEADLDQIEHEMKTPIKQAFPEAEEQLSGLVRDGLLLQNGRNFRATDTGKLLIRNVAAVFDQYLAEMRQRVRFSKAV
jgi:oxygen-independent coproporphyrinogen-3 oxidase